MGNLADDTGNHGFFYKGGTFSTLGPPGALQSGAADINNAGHIVGSFTDGAGEHGFLNVGGAFTTIDFPGATSTFALAIDNAGRILGFFDSPTGYSNVIAEGSSFTVFSCPGAFMCDDFNDNGQVVGTEGHEHGATGFVADIDGGNFDFINAPGGRFTTASGINNLIESIGAGPRSH